MMENLTTQWNRTNYSDMCEPQTDNPIRTPHFQAIVYILYSLIFIIAMIGNGVICHIVVSSPRMRTVTNYFIMNLAVGDILITIFCVPFTSISYLQQYWPFGNLLCPVVNYSQAVSVFVSAYTMLAISVDRYSAIMWPLRPRLSKKLASIIIGIIWLIAGITAIPIPVFSELWQPDDEWYTGCNRFLCRENWMEIGLEYEKMYTQILMLLQYIIPLSVLLFTYTSIAIVIWCHRIPGEAENSRDQRIAQSKRRMIKMMAIVVFVFSLCWLPFNLMWVFEDSISNEMKPYLWFTLHWLAMSHACYNPIIYCYMNSRFRNGFLQLISNIPCIRRYVPSLITLRPRSSTGVHLTSIEGTESTPLHRTNTATTYISLKKKNDQRNSTCNQFPIRSASVIRSSLNNHQQLVKRRQEGIVEDEI